MKTVSSRDANQHFAKILAEAVAGREVVITRYGEPVARLVPFRSAARMRKRQAAIKKLKAMSWDLDYANNKMTRDEMHER